MRECLCCVCDGCGVGGCLGEGVERPRRALALAVRVLGSGTAGTGVIVAFRSLGVPAVGRSVAPAAAAARRCQRGERGGTLALALRPLALRAVRAPGLRGGHRGASLVGSLRQRIANLRSVPSEPRLHALAREIL